MVYAGSACLSDLFKKIFSSLLLASSGLAGGYWCLFVFEISFWEWNFVCGKIEKSP